MNAPEIVIMGQLASIVTALAVPLIRRALHRLFRMLTGCVPAGPDGSTTAEVPGVRDGIEERVARYARRPVRPELLLGQIDEHFLRHARRATAMMLTLSTLAFFLIVSLVIELAIPGADHHYSALLVASPAGIAACVVTLFHRQSNRAHDHLREQGQRIDRAREARAERQHQLELITRISDPGARDALISALVLGTRNE
jgi:hypothetical protein